MPPEQVERALTDEPASVLPLHARAATHHGDGLLADVGFGDRVRVERPVMIELGTPLHLAEKTMIPMRWIPTGPGGVFPALEADLEIGSLAPGRTQLAISARYAPPLGPLGRVVDRVVLFRVAEATLKDFLDRVGAAVVAAPALELRKRVRES